MLSIASASRSARRWRVAAPDFWKTCPNPPGPCARVFRPRAVRYACSTIGFDIPSGAVAAGAPGLRRGLIQRDGRRRTGGEVAVATFHDLGWKQWPVQRKLGAGPSE